MKVATTSIKYDEIGDTLYISFAPGEKATGIELNEHLLLRVNKMERRPVGLTIFDYSILAQPTEAGMRSLPLTGLDALSDDLRDLALELLLRPPLNAILAVSLYTPFLAQSVPIATVIVDAREIA